MQSDRSVGMWFRLWERDHPISHGVVYMAVEGEAPSDPQALCALLEDRDAAIDAAWAYFWGRHRDPDLVREAYMTWLERIHSDPQEPLPVGMTAKFRGFGFYQPPEDREETAQ